MRKITFNQKKHNFIENFSEALNIVYHDCYKLLGLKDGKFSEVIDIAKDLFKVAACTLCSTYFGKHLAPQGQEEKGMAIGTSIGLLIALWQVKTEHEAKDEAKAFLLLFEDIKDNPARVKLRIDRIGEELFKRFCLAILCLSNDTNGVIKLARFFAGAIIKRFHQITKQYPTGGYEEDWLRLAIKAAIPKDEGDELYRENMFKKQRLDVDIKYCNVVNTKCCKQGNIDWTIEGILLRSPIYSISKENLYVRTDEKKTNQKNTHLNAIGGKLSTIMKI